MKRKKSIMHIINSFSLAGAEKLVFDIAKNINIEEYEIFICAIGSSTNKLIEEKIKEELLAIGVTTFCLEKKPESGRIVTLSKLVKIIKQNNIDIVHTHCPSPDMYGRIAAKVSGVKKIYTTIHNTAGYYPLMEKTIGKFTNVYIAISEQVKNYMIENLNISSHKIVVVKNGIDIQKYTQIQIDVDYYKKNLGILPQDVVITTIGRVTEQKGHKYLIKAIKKVKERYTDIKVLVVGDKGLDKNLYEELQHMVLKDNLENNILFLGNRQDIAEILKVSDMFVFPSIHEGFALVTLEAMASATPIIATDVGSIREIVVPDKNGLIVPPKDAQALAEKIIFLMENVDLSKSIATNGKNDVTEQFSIYQTTKKLEELYI
ncbi:glycosyltransferase [Priestia megaterium]|uniref:glycosyltransferase n=1 Tax=Priestia megaterium TaxID=1404 RepID=UPI0018857546|nr:glycosyltransferase [Priestia megaterium]